MFDPDPEQTPGTSAPAGIDPVPQADPDNAEGSDGGSGTSSPATDPDNTDDYQGDSDGSSSATDPDNTDDYQGDSDGSSSATDPDNTDDYQGDSDGSSSATDPDNTDDYQGDSDGSSSATDPDNTDDYQGDSGGSSSASDPDNTDDYQGDSDGSSSAIDSDNTDDSAGADDGSSPADGSDDADGGSCPAPDDAPSADPEQPASDADPNADALQGASDDADQNAGNSDVDATAANCDDAAPAQPPIGPTITIAQPIVLVKRAYTTPKRQPVVLGVDDNSFDGSGKLTISSAAIKFFDAAAGGNAVASGTVFPGAKLDSQVTIFAEGASPSAALNDVKLTLTLTKGSRPVKPPVNATMTAVRVTLDICQSRTSAAADPVPVADKIAKGRFLQVQNSNSCGRGMLRIHKAEPAAFAGNLVLVANDAKVKTFAAADEKPAAGQAALPARVVIANAPIAAAGEKRWAEAVSVSAALIDTGYKLGLDGIDDDGDRVAITCVHFTSIVATIKSTPGIHGARAGFAAPLPYTFTVNSLSPDFTVNAPLVMMRNSQPDVQLAVTAEPANLPIRWQAIRNSADHANLGNAGAVPTVSPDNGLTTKLNVNNKGSFRIRAYIDCNGDNKYDDGIDLEPSMPLNLVLANATVVTDNTVVNAGNLAAAPLADGRVYIANGTFTPLNPAINMDLICNVTGGGADGKLGLDKVFAGLINNLTLVNIQVTYKDSTVAPPQNHPISNLYVSNPTVATGVFLGRPSFKPGDPAPAALAWPVLDSGRSPNGQGGDTSTMGGSRLAKNNAPAFGQQWRITCVDAPGRAFPKNHPIVPAAVLSRINYSQQFAANFCFWTNVTKNSGATGDPADRLYSVLRIDTWQVAGAWNVVYPAPPAGAPPGPPPPAPPATLTVTTPHTVAIPSRTTFDMGRAQDHNVEVREPSGITTAIAWDCRT